MPACCPSHIHVPGYDAWTGQPASIGKVMNAAGSFSAAAVPVAAKSKSSAAFEESLREFLAYYGRTTHLPVEHVFFDGGQFAQIGKGTRRIMVPFLYLAIKSLYWSKGGTLKKIMWCDDDAIKPYFIAAGKALTYGSMRRQMADSLEDKPFPALPEDLQCRCWFEFGSAEDHLKYRAGNAGHSAVRLQEVFRAVSEPVPGRDRNRA